MTWTCTGTMKEYHGPGDILKQFERRKDGDILIVGENGKNTRIYRIFKEQNKPILDQEDLDRFIKSHPEYLL